MVGRRRAMFVCEATGKRAIHLAEGGERKGIVDTSAVVDAIGRHRLAQTTTHADARTGRLKKTERVREKISRSVTTRCPTPMAMCGTWDLSTRNYRIWTGSIPIR